MLLPESSHRGINRKVIALATARGKHHLIVAASEHRRDAVPSRRDGVPARRRKGVSGAWITKVLKQERRHRARDFGPNRRRGVVIKIGTPLKDVSRERFTDPGVLRPFATEKLAHEVLHDTSSDDGVPRRHGLTTTIGITERGASGADTRRCARGGHRVGAHRREAANEALANWRFPKK